MDKASCSFNMEDRDIGEGKKDSSVDASGKTVVEKKEEGQQQPQEHKEDDEERKGDMEIKMTSSQEVVVCVVTAHDGAVGKMDKEPKEAESSENLLPHKRKGNTNTTECPNKKMATSIDDVQETIVCCSTAPVEQNTKSQGM